MLRSGFVYCAYGGRSSFALLLILIFFTALERENLIFLFISHAPRRLQTSLQRARANGQQGKRYFMVTTRKGRKQMENKCQWQNL